MSEDWQFYFRVKGLTAQEEDILFNNRFLFRGVKDKIGQTHVFFKAKVKAAEKEKLDKKVSEVRNIVDNFLKIYYLTTGIHVELLSGVTATRIQPDNPFGNPKHAHIGRAMGYVVRSREEERALRERYTHLLNKTMKTFDSWGFIFSDKKMSYLVNALEYLYHATGDERLEQKLIDLIISMESLFGEDQELRLRISLRATYLLSAGREGERPRIFNRIYDLYNKRSRIVHGGEEVPLTSEEVSGLECFVRESIMRLIPSGLSKKDVATLLDQSVYDEDKRKEIDNLILRSEET